jgi:hypothetical protein
MKSKALLSMANTVVMLAIGIGTLAQAPTPKHLSAGKVVGPREM